MNLKNGLLLIIKDGGSILYSAALDITKIPPKFCLVLKKEQIFERKVKKRKSKTYKQLKIERTRFD
jgi:hypothetical protein